MTANTELAARAADLAAHATPGSMDRRAAGSVTVALRTTSSLTGARRALETLRDPAVRQAAERLLDELTPGTGE
jgi:hypothetical protein